VSTRPLGRAGRRTAVRGRADLRAAPDGPSAPGDAPGPSL